MDVNIRIAGEAGQGVQTAGDLLVQVFAGLGLHVLATQSYMSRIRGGLNWYDVRIADTPLPGGTERVDLLVALTGVALEELRGEVAPGGLVLFDGESQEGVISVEFSRLAKETGGSVVMSNAVASGAVFAALCYDVERLVEHLGHMFGKKGPEVVERNAACARQGAAVFAAKAGCLAAPRPGEAPGYLTNGSNAVALGAATAGVKFVSSYPMSPSTGVLNGLADLADRYGIVVEQAEDEIAAINMACGANYAGVPAMTTTSGGGFALMTEGLSLAGMMELPVFIYLAQRPGPATGLPTRTGQEDLRFVISAGHGEFARAVFAPGNLRQCYDLTRHALQVAHRYQTPAVLLSDQYLADLHANLPPLDEAYQPIDRCLELSAGAGYERYVVTESGISPRAMPGGEALVVMDSDEHTPDGHLTENLAVRVEMVDKRLRKEAGLLAEALPPERYGAAEADTLLVCWGSTYGPAREAVDLLTAAGHSVAMLHFSQVWPLSGEALRPLLQARRVLCVEGNARGQLAAVLREIGALSECELILRYDGRPFTGSGLAEEVTR